MSQGSFPGFFHAQTNLAYFGCSMKFTGRVLYRRNQHALLFGAARACVAKYGVAGLESQSDKRVLEKANIPVDIRFAYE